MCRHAPADDRRDYAQGESKGGPALLYWNGPFHRGQSWPVDRHKLRDLGRKNERVQVVGTLDCPVHAMNLEQAVFMVRRCYPDHVIVAVDASVGRSEHVGCITLGKGALRPGLGVCKELQAVGDIFITGIVGGCGSCDPLMLQSVRLSVVMRMAIISATACGRRWFRKPTIFVEEFYRFHDAN